MDRLPGQSGCPHSPCSSRILAPYWALVGQVSRSCLPLIVYRLGPPDFLPLPLPLLLPLPLGWEAVPLPLPLVWAFGSNRAGLAIASHPGNLLDPIGGCSTFPSTVLIGLLNWKICKSHSEQECPRPICPLNGRKKWKDNPGWIVPKPTFLAEQLLKEAAALESQGEPKNRVKKHNIFEHYKEDFLPHELPNVPAVIQAFKEYKGRVALDPSKNNLLGCFWDSCSTKEKGFWMTALLHHAQYSFTDDARVYHAIKFGEDFPNYRPSPDDMPDDKPGDNDQRFSYYHHCETMAHLRSKGGTNNSSCLRQGGAMV